MAQKRLFSNKMTYTFFDRQIEGLRKAALSMPPDALADEAKAILDLREKFEVGRIELQLEDMETPAVDEDEQRRPRVTVIVHARGDQHTPSVLEIRPSQATGMPPPAEIVPFRAGRSTAIKLEYVGETSEVNPDGVNLWRQQCLTDLEQWVAWLNDDIGEFYNRVAQEASKLVSKRKAELAVLQRLRDELS